MAEPKKRRFTRKDWNKVEEYIKKELESRRANPFRKKHEKRWEEVDRQVQMEALSRTPRGDNKNDDWRAAIEVGELSKASEVISADVRRMVFPTNRGWFEPHAKLDRDFDADGNQIADPRQQKIQDGRLRALMSQQHLDFGLKGRQDLSVKEALHHGGYVVTVEMESEVITEKGTFLSKKAPVWKPHSMWNCYPDSSPSITGTNMFYPGSMVIVSYMPLYKVKRLSGDGYMPANYSKIPETNKGKEGEDKDCEIVTFYGDLVVERKGDDLYLPNCKVMTANGTIIYYKENDLPFNPVIYNGWERLDVRDPYYVSPLVKMSPTQRSASIMASRLIDAVDMSVEPPCEYDANDPDYVLNGGPDMSPGAMNGKKGSSNLNVLDVGDPTAALYAVQWYTSELRSGTGVGGPRTGVAEGTEQTATEIAAIKQGGEIRTVDFVDKHEMHGIRPFLYMQHELNKRFLEDYTFYNRETESDDFEIIGKSDIPNQVHFEVTGSRGTINEEQRIQKTMNVTAYASQNPLFAPLLTPDAILMDMYLDAGVKEPERYMQGNPVDQAMQQMQEQVQQVVGQLQQQIAELEEQIAVFEIKDQEQAADDAEKDAKHAATITGLKEKIARLNIQLETMRGIQRSTWQAQSQP